MLENFKRGFGWVTGLFAGIVTINFVTDLLKRPKTETKAETENETE